MKDRLVILLEHYKLSSAHFADSIGVQRSNISHILSGRNNPSYDFLIKTLEFFTEIQAEWLLLGKGPMLKSNTNQPSGEESLQMSNNMDLFSQANNRKEPVKSTSNDNIVKDKNSYKDKEIVKETIQVTNVNSNSTSVERIIFVYNDNTFEIIKRK